MIIVFLYFTILGSLRRSLHKMIGMYSRTRFEHGKMRTMLVTYVFDCDLAAMYVCSCQLVYREPDQLCYFLRFIDFSSVSSFNLCIIVMMMVLQKTCPNCCSTTAAVSTLNCCCFVVMAARKSSKHELRWFMTYMYVRTNVVCLFLSVLLGAAP